MNLQSLIDCLTLNNNVHICIHDISGLLNQPLLNIRNSNKMHSKEFCNYAKSTDNGMKLCFSCKILANKKAIEGKKLFIGNCPFEITEIVKPIIICNTVVAIIYIGNILKDEISFTKNVAKICKITGVNSNSLLNQANNFCKTKELDKYIKIAELINDFILLLYDKSQPTIKTNKHWAVDAIKNYANINFNKDISLSKLSNLYYLNENYIGRVFCRQEGISFIAYLNGLRIKEACKLLKNTDLTVTDISSYSGFNNVTYFNRIFKKTMNLTPLEYRKNLSN